MIVHQYVKDFENMGLGMFVHFGVYSVLAHGEWVMHQHKIPREEYRSHAPEFCPEEDWGIVCICSSGVPDKVNGIRKCLYTIVHLLYGELLK